MRQLLRGCLGPLAAHPSRKGPRSRAASFSLGGISVKRFVLSTSIAVSILAGCGAATPSAAPSEGTPAPSVSAAPVSAAPSPSQAASAVCPTWFTEACAGAGILPAGSQTTRNFLPGFTFTVPDGWVNSADGADVYGLFPDTPANAAEHAASGGLAHDMAVFRFPSPYFFCDAFEDNRGATAAEMVASMVANEALAASEPVDVTIGGLTGKQVDLRLDPGWTETCPGDPPTFDLADTRTRVILLDSPDRGIIVIGLTSLHSAGHEAFLAGAMPIIESFQFEMAQ